ncbi:MAG: hypothetical protein P8Y70_01550 [Candidatus Lokiarchaeota archaeon]
MLIELSLFVIIMLTVFTVVNGGNWSSVSGSGTLGHTDTFYINTVSLSGALAIIIVIGVIVTLIGIQVLGSGLSNTSVKALTTIIAYYGIWTTFSVLAFALILSIKVFGLLIYISLTIMYTIGIINKLTTSGGVSQ